MLGILAEHGCPEATEEAREADGCFPEPRVLPYLELIAPAIDRRIEVKDVLPTGGVMGEGDGVIRLIPGPLGGRGR